MTGDATVEAATGDARIDGAATDDDATDGPASDAYDVIVVGAGIAGCAAARELAPDHDVLVVEKGQVAAAATALSAGEVTMAPSYADFPVVATHATEFFREYDGTGEFRFHERPSYELVKPGRGELAQRRVDRLRGEGIDVQYVPAGEVAEQVPRLRTDDIDGAIRHADTGFVDPHTFAVTLKADAEDRGAEFLTETTVRGVLVDDDSDDGDAGDGTVRGVATEAGDVAADVVVAAAGWRTRTFLEGTLEIPVRPYRTQVLVLEPETDLPREFPMGWIPGEHVYFRPELNGDLLVGGWSFVEDDPETASRDADERFRQHVAGLLPTYFEGFDRAGFVNGWAGIDGATPDTRPIVDRPADGPDGLVVATGFHGRGIMTAPVTATLVRAHVADEATDLPTGEFALSRFDSTSPDFEFTSISAGDDDYEAEAADYDGPTDAIDER